MHSQEDRLNPHRGRVSTDTAHLEEALLTLANRSVDEEEDLVLHTSHQEDFPGYNLEPSGSDSTPTVVGDLEHHASLLKDFPVMMKAVVTRAELPQLSIFL